jgi:hypothetical protein
MSSRRPTIEHTPVLAVVVVGGPEALIEAVRRVVALIGNATVATADVKAAATQVARVRPVAVIMSEEIYAFDAAEFDALARDVQSTLIALPADAVPARVLQQRLTPLVMDAFREYFKN